MGCARARARAGTPAIHPVRAWHWVTPCAGACAQACMRMHACTHARTARCKGTCMMQQLLLYPPPRRPPVSFAPCAAQPATRVTGLRRVRPQGRRPGAGRQGPHHRTKCVFTRRRSAASMPSRCFPDAETQMPSPLTRGHGRARACAPARAVGLATDRPSRGRVHRCRTKRQALPRNPRPYTFAHTCAAPSDSVRSIDNPLVRVRDQHPRNMAEA